MPGPGVGAILISAMSALEPQSTGGPPPSCARCGEVIGVYEPLVEIMGELARHTSRAAEPEVCPSGTPCYHRACYEFERSELS